MLNGILTSVLFPVLLVAMFVFGRNSDLHLVETITQLPMPLKTLAAVAILLFCSSLNGTAASAFSREGACFWLSKVVPVRYRDQILGKLLHALAVSGLGLAAGAIFVLFFLKLTFTAFILALVLAALGAAAFAALGLAIDLFHPLLDWVSPHKAIKQNPNVFGAMVLDAALTAGLGYAASRLWAAGVAPVWIYLGLIGVATAIGGIALTVLAKTARRHYRRVEK